MWEAQIELWLPLRKIDSARRLSDNDFSDNDFDFLSLSIFSKPVAFFQIEEIFNV